MRLHLSVARSSAPAAALRALPAGLAAGLAAGLLAGAVLAPAAATARTIRLPEAAPVVTFEVPDDWAVTAADGGLQLVSPDHTSIVLAGVAKADKTGLGTWQRNAGRRMVDFGISFDSKANPSPGARSLASDDPLAPLVDPKAQAAVKAGELAPLSAVPSMALLGRPSDVSVAEIEAGGKEAGPGEAGKLEAGKIEAGKPETGKAAGNATATDRPDAAPSNKAPADKAGSDKAGSDKAAAEKSAADKATADKTTADKATSDKTTSDKAAAQKAAADKTGKPLHFASVVIRGASLAGKPVDVQFLNFGYSKEKWFLMQQESAPDDDRAGAIVKSVRAVR